VFVVPPQISGVSLEFGDGFGFREEMEPLIVLADLKG